MVVGKLNKIKAFLVLLHFAIIQGELRMKKTFTVNGISGELKWDVVDTKFHVEITVGYKGFVAVGFAHSPEFNHTQAEFDGFVGGVLSNGSEYGASYALRKGKMVRYPEDRFQLKKSSENDRGTTLILERIITTCFKESFDARNVGDLAFVKVIIDPAANDLASIVPTPKSIDFNELEMVIFPVTLFTKSQDESQINSELTIQSTNSFSLRHNNEAVQNKFALCMLDYTTEDFTHWKGYILETKSTNNYKDGVQLMVAYQCDNVAIPTGNGAPDTRKTVTDACQNDLGVTYVNRKCQDVLFVWSPGSDGEVLPKDMGIEVKPKNADGRRYVMLMTYYKKALSTDSSGMTLVHGSGSSFTKVAKMMVGHYVSSKMVVMPGQDWTVQGICHSDCSANSELTSTTEITVVSANIHHKSAAKGDIKYSTEPNKDSIKYESLLKDSPANSKFQPTRTFSEGKKINSLTSDVVVECMYNYDGRYPLEGGHDPEQEYCFGVLTHYPPLPVSKCMSIPTEVSLEVAFNMRLKFYEDQDKKRRRKRQSDDLVLGFWSRSLIQPEGTEVRKVLDDIARDLRDKPQDLQGYNAKTLNGNHLPICVSKSDGFQSNLKARKIPLVGNGDIIKVPNPEECQKIIEGEEALSPRTGILQLKQSSANLNHICLILFLKAIGIHWILSI